MENNSYPVSIEIFAAYMDGNLSIEEMHNIESLINNNNSLCQIKFIYDEIETKQDSVMDSEYLDKIESHDFKIPDVSISEQGEITDEQDIIDDDNADDYESNNRDSDEFAESENEEDDSYHSDDDDNTEESDNDIDEDPDDEIDNDN